MAIGMVIATEIQMEIERGNSMEFERANPRVM